MKKYSKIVGTVVASSALLSTSIVGIALNNSSKTIDTVDMQLSLDAKENGKSVDLSILNASMSNSFQLSLKLNGDVKYRDIILSKVITDNGIVNVGYDEASNVITIVVTSDVDLVKGGVLEIGTLVVEGADGVEYSINDNVVSGSPTITMVTPTYDEVCDFDLDEVGDTKISISNNDVQEPDDEETEDEDTDNSVGEGTEDGNTDEDDNKEDNEEDNGVVGGTDEDDKENGGTTEEDDKEDSDVDNEEEEKPSIDVEVSVGTDGIKIITPKSEKGLEDLLSEILKKDANAKIVSIKEESDYYLYRIKMKNTNTKSTDSIFIDVKVAKSIKADEGLPGIDLEVSGDDTNNDSNTEVNKAPVIKAEDIVITVGDKFNVLEGVTAYDEEDGNLTDRVKVKKNNVEADKEGVYSVTYIVMDNNGNTTEKTIKVTVKAKEEATTNEKPVIEATDKVIELGSKVDLLDGVTAYDKEDGNLTDVVIIKESNVDLFKEGVYSLTYSVKDSDGNETTKTIKVTVVIKNTENNTTTNEGSNNSSDTDKEVVKTNDNVTAYGLTMLGSLMSSVMLFFKVKRRK